MITIAETAPFQRKIASLLSDEERADLIAYLAEHPSDGVLIQGTGAYSRPSLPLIPDESCHPFHGKAATDSTAKLPPWRLAR